MKGVHQAHFDIIQNLQWWSSTFLGARYSEQESVCGAFEKVDVHCKCLQGFIYRGTKLFCNIKGKWL